MDTILHALNAALTTRWAGSKDRDRSYANALRACDGLPGNALLSELTDEFIEAKVSQWQAEALAPSTINRRLSALSGPIKDAARLKRNADFTPPYIPHLKEAKGRDRILTPDEVADVVAWFEIASTPSTNHYAHLVTFLVNTGLRVGEALALTQHDIDHTIPAVTVRDSKAGKSRTVPLNPAALNATLELAQVGGFAALDSNRFNKLWQRARQSLMLNADQQFVPHALRHTFASNLVAAGTDIAVVSLLLGHSNIAMTMRYAHYNTATLAEAVNVL